MFSMIWSKRQSVVLTWLFSYLAVLFVPVVLSLIVYNEASKALKSEIRRANDILLMQVQEVMNKEIDNIVKLSVELTWNSGVQDLMYSNKPNSEMKYTAFEVTKDFSWYKSSFGFVDEFYVYWEKEDSVVLPGAILESELAYRYLHASETFAYEDWHKLMRTEPYRGFVSLPHLSGGSDHDSIAFISSLPKGIRPDSVGSVIIIIDAERLLRTIENAQAYNGGDVFILNENNEVLISNSEADPDELPFANRLAGKEGFFADVYHGVESEIRYIHSAPTNIKYVSAMPSSLVWEKAEYVRRLTTANIAVSVLGGGLLTFFFLRRNYRPVKRLMKVLSGSVQSGMSNDEATNEFQIIEHIVSNTLSEKERMSLRLKQQSNWVRSNTLMRLLKGKLDGPVPIGEALTSFNIIFQTDTFAVMLCYIENTEEFLSRLPGRNQTEKLNLQQFIVINVVEELVGGVYASYMTEIEESMACVIGLSEHDEQASANLQRLADEAKTFLSDMYKIDLTIAISGTHKTLGGISVAYQEAKDAMEYKMVMGSKEVLLYEKLQNEISLEPMSGYYYPAQLELQLVNYMKIGDFTQAKELLEDIRYRNFEKRGISFHSLKSLVLHIASSMLKTINESDSSSESFFAARPRLIEELVQGDSFHVMFGKLVELLSEVCGFMSEKLDQQSEQSRADALRNRVVSIRHFVEERYHDVNLNITTIGEHFQMKPTYLSKLFKDSTGEGLLDYLNKVRIDKAKAILTKTAWKGVAEVAGEVGFSEVATFIRVFKKYEGITPGKYREIN